MINKSFDQIEKTDIEALVANNVSEGRTIDYKEQLPGNADADKREFLGDVSSFANASGGDLLYGVIEKRDGGKPTGIPDTVPGLTGINADQEILRLESSIRDGIDPRIPGIQIRTIDGFVNGSTLLIHIPKSWASPHMVTYKGSARFYSRDNRGKYQLDVREIRAAFGLSEELPDKIRRFRDERLARIVADETPVRLDPCAKMVLHILPIAALDPTTRIDVTPLAERTVKLQPIYASGWNHRFNFDGFLTYSEFPQSPSAHTYLQIFRSGAVEAVEAYVLRVREAKKTIASIAYEKELIEALDRYLAVVKELGLQPPIFVMLTLLGIKDYVMSVSTRYWSDGHAIDRDVLILPDAVVESFEAKAASILQPAFDAIWQAAGWPKSLNYDRDGNWRPHDRAN